MKNRIIAVGIIKNQANKYLISQMPADHGVFPDQWGLIGGGMEPGETIEKTLIREIREETSLKVLDLKPLFFSDDHRTKIFRDGISEEQYLIYLYFEVLVSGKVVLNDEWVDYSWTDLDKMESFNLNQMTGESLARYRKFIHA